jgi:hypothetical protein
MKKADPAFDDSSEKSSTLSEMRWLLPPNLLPGTRLQLTSLIKADSVTPEVLDALTKFMMELQSSSQVEDSDGGSCAVLVSCGNFSGGCTGLASCGAYAPIVKEA